MFKRSAGDRVGVILLGQHDSYHGWKEYSSILQIREFWWFLIGKIFYFGSGVVLAAVLKDNRAFCKYLCAIAVFLKLGARFSVVKIKETTEGCNDCGICERNCPMDIKIRDYTRNKLRV